MELDQHRTKHESRLETNPTKHGNGFGTNSNKIQQT